MTDTNNVISVINSYQYDIRKETINKLAKLNTREFIKKEYKIIESLLNKGNDDKVAKEIKKAIFGNKDAKFGWNEYADNLLKRIEHINKASMAYDKYLVNLNCKYHVLYSEENIKAEDIKAYDNKPLDIDEGSNYVILDRHNTHARIINYDRNEVNYIDIPRRNFALSPNKLIRGSEYTLYDTINKDVRRMKCDNDHKDSNISWLCNGLYHSIYHSIYQSIKNMKKSDNLNIVVPLINIDYYTSIDISKKMTYLLRDETDEIHYFELTKYGGMVKNKSKFNAFHYCTVSIIKQANKRITIIGLVLFDRINYIHSIFKDISDDYDVIIKFIEDDIFKKIKDNHIKFPTFVYKMCCLSYAIRYYLHPNYETTIIDLYYAAKLVFFSCFNCYFEGKIDKKNITELTTDEQINLAYNILIGYLSNDVVFEVHVNNSNRDWLNLDDLNKLGYKQDNYRTATGAIKMPKLTFSDKQDKLKDVIPKYLEEVRNEISYLYTAHDNFEDMINEIIENGSISQSNLTTDIIESVKQVIVENTGKLVCIPVFCINRHTSYVNYKLMERIIKKINEKIKKEAGVEEDIISN